MGVNCSSCNCTWSEELTNEMKDLLSGQAKNNQASKENQE